MKKVKLRIEALFISLFMMLSLCSVLPKTTTKAVDYNFVFPVNNGVKIAYVYGYSDAYGDTFHTGIDIHDKNNDDTVYAAYSGVVDDTANSCDHWNYGAACSHHNTGGNYIRIKGDNGLYFYYFHLTRNMLLVKKGDRVTAGQPIAVMGSSGYSTGRHLHFEVRTSTSSSSKINVNPTGNGGLITYKNGPYTAKKTYQTIPAGNYYMKNTSTGTYLYLPGSDTNGSTLSLGAKKDTNSFKMGITQIKSGNADRGHYIVPKGCTRAVNPYSDAPSNGTKITLYDKTTNGHQYWCFEKHGDGYIVHMKYNQNLVLTGSGTNVTLATNTKSANQIWILEDTAVVPTLSSIAINPDSIGTMYEDGSIFNPSGLTLTATYSDGSTKNITEGYTVGNVDLSTVGNSVLTVSYEGKTATADITVQDLFDGNGTAESPYLVNNSSDLKMVADMTNNTAANNCYGHAYYKQTSDIDLGESDWISIGCFYANGDYSNVNNSAAFYGHYDGNCYTIRNLTMNYKNKYAGLFGRIANNSVVENLSVYGTINSTTLYSGGIVGEIGHGASVKNCSFTGSVTGSYYVGGITGKIYRGGSIINCYANAEITASDEKGVAGGILSIAQIDSTSDTYNVNISNCYFTGKINSFTNGGIIAQTAIADGASASMNIFNCYYLNNASTGVAQAGCTGLISSQLKTIATDLGSPFADNADDTLNNGYPVFEWQIETSDEKVSGDANNDGAIDLKDVVMIRRYVAGGWDVEIDTANADVNADNTVDLKDVVLIRRYIAGGWDVELK